MNAVITLKKIEADAINIAMNPSLQRDWDIRRLAEMIEGLAQTLIAMQTQPQRDWAPVVKETR